MFTTIEFQSIMTEILDCLSTAPTGSNVDVESSEIEAELSAEAMMFNVEVELREIDASCDTDGTVVSYDWDFKDGTGSGATTTHTYTATGTYDVVVTVGPSFTTQRTEARQSMSEFIQYYPQSAPLIGDLYAKSMDWPGAEEVAKRLEFLLPPEIRKQKEDEETS